MNDYGARTTLEGNTDFPFKQGLLTRGRARFKHRTVNFRAPNVFVTLWFELDYVTNPPLDTLMI
jgi:hypothetical protein